MKRTLCVFLAAIMIAFGAACGKQEQQSEVESSSVALPGSSVAEQDRGYEAYRIACIYAEVTGDSWSAAFRGCEAALEELEAAYGIEGYCVAPANTTDYGLQMDLIEAAVKKEVDGIVLHPVDPDAIGTFITDHFTAEEQPAIIVIDRACNTQSDAVAALYIADGYAMEQEMGKLAAEALENEGVYGYIGLLEPNPWDYRAWGAEDWIAEHAPGMQPLSEEIYKTLWEAQAQDLTEVVGDIIASNPGKLCLFTFSQEAKQQMMQMVSELSEERRREITVIGYGFSRADIEYIRAGKLYGTVGKDFYKMGYESVYLLCDFLAGEEIAQYQYAAYCAVTKNNLTSQTVIDYCTTMGIEL